MDLINQYFFDEAWDASKVPADLSGKTYLITGTSAGLGLHVAYQLAKRGAKVIGANRNLEKAQKNIDILKQDGDNLDGYSMRQCDVSSFESVRTFAAELLADDSVPYLDVLLLNAGIMALPERKESVDGHEMQMATNVFGHHLLTSLLLPKLLSHPKRATIVSTSSSAPLGASASSWDDIDSKNSYSSWGAYGMSKSAAIQFRDGLRERIAKAGLTDKIRVLSTQPGAVATDLQAHAGGSLHFVAMDATKGSLSSLRVCVDEELEDGSFVGPAGLTGLWGFPVVCNEYRRGITLDHDLREKMWKYSDEATGADWSALTTTSSE